MNATRTMSTSATVSLSGLDWHRISAVAILVAVLALIISGAADYAAQIDARALSGAGGF